MSRQRRQPGQEQASPFDSVRWPLYREQQALQAHDDPAEIAAAQHRAQLLITHGWAPLADWLDAPITPAEQRALQRQQQHQQDVLSVFD